MYCVPACVPVPIESSVSSLKEPALPNLQPQWHTVHSGRASELHCTDRPLSGRLIDEVRTGESNARHVPNCRWQEVKVAACLPFVQKNGHFAPARGARSINSSAFYFCSRAVLISAFFEQSELALPSCCPYIGNNDQSRVTRALKYTLALAAPQPGTGRAAVGCHCAH